MLCHVDRSEASHRITPQSPLRCFASLNMTMSYDELHRSHESPGRHAMPNSVINTVDTSAAPPPSRWLRLAHIACVAVALLAVGLFVVGLPLYYDLLRTPCLIESCKNTDQILIEQLQQLENE